MRHDAHGNDDSREPSSAYLADWINEVTRFDGKNSGEHVFEMVRIGNRRAIMFILFAYVKRFTPKWDCWSEVVASM